MIREFRLSTPGTGRGVSCNANGAFVGSVPLLKRVRANNGEMWVPRASDEISEAISSDYGLPIDVSSKMGGLRAISRALNEGDIARAQMATVLLAFPEPPTLSKSRGSRDQLIKFVRDLYQSNLIKADWDPDEHPRWPAGAPDSQGGQFAPEGEGDSTQAINAQASTADGVVDRAESNDFLHYGAQEGHLDDGVYRPGIDPAGLDPAGDPRQLLLNRLTHDAQVLREMRSWRKRGFVVTPNITFEDPRTGVQVVADYAVSAWMPDPMSYFLTETLLPIYVRDVKTGEGGLQPNQKQVYPYILSGGQVVPLGDNAAWAGFDVGELTVIGPIFHVGRDAPNFTEH